MWQAETECAVIVTVKGKKQVEGRIVSLPDATVFHRSKPRESLATGSFSLDERAAWYLMQHAPEVKEIHFVDASGAIYTVAKDTFWRLSERHECGSRHRIHLPVEHWTKHEAWYEVRYQKGEPEKFAVSFPPEPRGPTTESDG
jgi:hypothetical protein